MLSVPDTTHSTFLTCSFTVTYGQVCVRFYVYAIARLLSVFSLLERPFNTWAGFFWVLLFLGTVFARLCHSVSRVTM